jgi:phosphatidylserine/phosphatidylglycerophosphate/cardiolipin synthase-like enzyme
VRDLIRAQTLDVLRLLKRDGFPMDKVRVMKTCHTKGILVDSRWTLVGSHNWTNEGVLYNRDASLLFDNAQITAYFEKVLDHDWRYLAEHIDVDETQPSAILPLPGENIPGETLIVDPRLSKTATSAG